MKKKTSQKILVIEDDPHISMGLVEVLQSEGYPVAACHRGDTAAAQFASFKPDLVILDIMLPGANGFDLCKEFRKSSPATIILMLSAKGQELDKVLGLKLGADDYMTKPFGVRELTARVEALFRRAGKAPDSETERRESVLRVGASEIDLKKFQLKRGRICEDLTAREIRLLQLFHEHVGEVLSRDMILNEVWGFNYMGTTRTLDQVIVQLRKKLGDAADAPRHLQTVHGVGYKLVL